MRKLATAAGAFSCGIFAAIYILELDFLLPVAILLAVTGTGLMFLRRKWLRGVEIALIFAALGLSFFRLYYQRNNAAAQELLGVRTVTAKVTEFTRVYDDYSSVEVKLYGEDGVRTGVRLYSYKDDISYLKPGDIISFSAKFTYADTRYGEESLYYFSNGVFLKANLKFGITVLEEGAPNLLNFPKYLNRYLVGTVDELFSRDTAPFVRSLMLGDKSELYNDTPFYVAMCRSGMMHTVAVSGMHIAFLVAFLQSLLGRGRRSDMICIALVWIFVVMTGSNPSAVRAGVMQTAVLAASMFGREQDDITSLLFSLGLILLADPYSAAGVGLQLSFASMLGLITVNEPLYAALDDIVRVKKAVKLKNTVTRLVAASLSAMAFALPIMSVYFGYISILAPLVCVLTMWAVSLCFRAGYIACIVFRLIRPLGVALAWLARLLVKYIGAVARAASSLPFAVVYTDSLAIAVWIAATYLLIFAAVKLSKAGRFRVLIAFGLSAAILLCAYLTNNSRRNAFGTISVLDVGQGQCIAVTSGDSTVMIDCGNTQTEKNAAIIADNYLFNNRIKDIDALVLTHMHSDHCCDVPELFEVAKVNEVVMLESREEDGRLAEKISDAGEAHGIDFKYVDKELISRYGDITVHIYPPLNEKDDNEYCLFILVSIGKYDVLITGDNPAGTEVEFVRKYKLPEIETIIVGHHGSKYSSDLEYLQTVAGENAIISVGYNTYGHPTSETLERLSQCDYNIYRTDLNGTVTVTVGSEYGD